MNKQEEECKKAGYVVHIAENPGEGVLIFMNERFKVKILNLKRYRYIPAKYAPGHLAAAQKRSHLFAEIEIIE
jgi:hypothetical protein